MTASIAARSENVQLTRNCTRSLRSAPVQSEVVVTAANPTRRRNIMSEIVRKGYLSVRRRNLLASSSYKQKYVVLRISQEDQGKLVEIWESQSSEKEPYHLVLGSMWTVQNKQSSSGKRHAFQLLVGDEVVLTFGCSSVSEREEWMKAFDVFRQIALPAPEHPALHTVTSTDEKNFFSVFLSKSHSSLEIHCGQYMLSVGNDAICLHWIRTTAIAHRWARKSIQELSIRGSHLVLKVCKPGSSSSNVMEFEFRATNATTVAILKRWNIVLMESIAANCGDPEQMNFIGKVLNKRVSDHPDGGRLTRSFRKRSQSTKEKRGDEVKRSGSFSNSRSATLHPSMLGSSSPLSKSSTNSPQKVSRASALTREAVDIGKPSHMQSTPPPLPPRPILDDSSSDGDSDYAYIEEKEVKGPARSSHSPSEERGASGGGDEGGRTLEEELEDLELSMKREKREKKRRAAQATTLAARPTHQRFPLMFTPADPEDYLEPLSALSGGRPRSTGDYELPIVAHNRSCSEPIRPLYAEGKSLSQPTIHTIRNSPPQLSPTPEHDTPPALPSRDWRVHSRQGHDSSDISPYAVVRQILPGKILEETDAHDTSSTSKPPSKESPASLEETQLADVNPPPSKQSTAPESVTSAPSTTTPPTSLPLDTATTDSASAPPIPPRSPIKEKLSWGSSTSSVASNHSCRSGHSHAPISRGSKSQRHRRTPVDKTLSEHRTQPMSQALPSSSHQLEKSSLPDLHSTTTGVPENSLQQRRLMAHRGRLTSTTESRSSSDGSTSSLHSQLNYLEVLPDSGGGSAQTGKQRNTNQENLQILDDFLQYFDDKVHSLTQPEGSPEIQKHTPVYTSPHSQTVHHMANGHTPSRRVNGVKDHPPPLQRAHTSASFIAHNLQQHSYHSGRSINSHSPAPPIPPRSDVSLGGTPSGRQPHYPGNHTSIHAATYHPRLWARTGSSGSFSSTSGDSRSPPAMFGGRTRQSSSSSVHSGTPSPTIGGPSSMGHPPPRSWQSLVRHFPNVPHEPDGSSTVFIHHLKQRRRVMHSHMV